MADRNTVRDYMRRNLDAVFNEHYAQIDKKLDKIQESIDSLRVSVSVDSSDSEKLNITTHNND